MKAWKKVLVASAFAALAANAGAAVITLDADTAATGSDLDIAPLVTPFGTITFTGEIRDRDGDPDFNAAGAAGDVFDIDGTTTATLSFSFDVSSITFIYGGNVGVFDIVARDAANAIVDSFFQASTDDGQPAGPITLSGAGIRSIFWQDPQGAFAPIDNVEINVPEPGSLALLALAGLALVGGRIRRSRAAR
jgi:hypothetical protein